MLLLFCVLCLFGRVRVLCYLLVFLFVFVGGGCSSCCYVLCRLCVLFQVAPMLGVLFCMFAFV